MMRVIAIMTTGSKMNDMILVVAVVAGFWVDFIML